MKKYVLEFVHRGLLAAAGGPVVLAIIYGILDATGAVTAFAPYEVCLGILSITLMAFIAAGITMMASALLIFFFAFKKKDNEQKHTA